ncbi:glycoside hydrolase family 20 zincin-like fold domain-containing protein [Brachybacterium sp. AOP25-B2-12]|uniref:glycoside hydrolase family 20 zincin-like fold domain-containing protein n=1 Tax=Brachybacterium sp. AOP25-B2-12 TaxID=3457710 RepID=UPI004033938A
MTMPSLRQLLPATAAVTAVVATTAVFPAMADEINATPIVIPAIQEWEGGHGRTILQDGARIVPDAELSGVAETLAEDADTKLGVTLDVAPSETTPRPGDIVLTYDPALDHAGAGDLFATEGYRLEVSDTIRIVAPTETGAFYATRSLLQIAVQSPDLDTLPQGTIWTGPPMPPGASCSMSVGSSSPRTTSTTPSR